MVDQIRRTTPVRWVLFAAAAIGAVAAAGCTSQTSGTAEPAGLQVTNVPPATQPAQTQPSQAGQPGQGGTFTVGQAKRADEHTACNTVLSPATAKAATGYAVKANGYSSGELCEYDVTPTGGGFSLISVSVSGATLGKGTRTEIDGNTAYSQPNPAGCEVDLVLNQGDLQSGIWLTVNYTAGTGNKATACDTAVKLAKAGFETVPNA